jgi:hypothetical protein
VEGAINNYGRSRALLGPGEITFVFGESHVPGLRAVGRGKSLQDECTISKNLAPKVPGNISNGKRHKSTVDLQNRPHYKVRAT